MQIGQLARQASVAVDTVRYYERCGLLAAPARRPSGYRTYQASDLERLRFIRRGKELGFTLEEIRELLRLNQHPDTDRSLVRALVSRRLADVDRQLEALQRVRGTLCGLEASCSGHGPVSGCPIIARVLDAPAMEAISATPTAQDLDEPDRPQRSSGAGTSARPSP